MQDSGCISRNYSSHSQAGSVGVSMAGAGTTNRSTALQMNETQFCDDILSCILALDEVIAEFDDPLSSLNSISESSSGGNTVPELPSSTSEPYHSFPSEDTNLCTPVSTRESPKTKPRLDNSQRNNSSFTPVFQPPPHFKTAGSSFSSSPSTTPRLIIPIQSWNCRQSSTVISSPKINTSSSETTGYEVRGAVLNSNGNGLDHFLVERQSSSHSHSHLPRNFKSSAPTSSSSSYPHHHLPIFGASYPAETDFRVPFKPGSGRRQQQKQQQNRSQPERKLFPEQDFLLSPPPGAKRLSSSSSFKHESKGSKALSKSITLSDNTSSGLREVGCSGGGGSFPKVKLKSVNPLVEFRSVKMQNFILPDDLPEELVKENWLFPTGKNLPRSLARTRKTCIAEQEEEEMSEKEYNPRFTKEGAKVPGESSSTCSSSTSSACRAGKGEERGASKKNVVNAPLPANPQQILEPGEPCLESRIPVPIAKPRRGSRTSSTTSTTTSTTTTVNSNNKPMQYVTPEVKARAAVEGVTIAAKSGSAPISPRQFITTASISPDNMKLPNSNNSSEGDDGYLSMINRTDDYRGIWPEELIENEIFSEEELKGLGTSPPGTTIPPGHSYADPKYRDVASEKTDYFSDDSLESEHVPAGNEQDESGISVSPIPVVPVAPLVGGISYDLVFDKDPVAPVVAEHVTVVETQNIRFKVPPKGEKVECPTFTLDKPKSRKPCSFFIPLSTEETQQGNHAGSKNEDPAIHQTIQAASEIISQQSSSHTDKSPAHGFVSTNVVINEEHVHERSEVETNPQRIASNSQQRPKKPRQRIVAEDEQLCKQTQEASLKSSENSNLPPPESSTVNVNTGSATVATAREREHESDGGAVTILTITSGSEPVPHELSKPANQNEFFSDEDIRTNLTFSSSRLSPPPPPSLNKIDQFAKELIKQIEQSAFAEAQAALNTNLKSPKTNTCSTSSENVTKIIINPTPELNLCPAESSHEEHNNHLPAGQVLENNPIKMTEQNINATSPRFLNNNPRVQVHQEFNIDLPIIGPLELETDFIDIPLPPDDEHEYYNSRSESLNRVQEFNSAATDEDVSLLSDDHETSQSVTGSGSNIDTESATAPVTPLSDLSCCIPNAVQELLPEGGGNGSLDGVKTSPSPATVAPSSGTSVVLIERTDSIPISSSSSPKAHFDFSPSSDLGGGLDSGPETQLEEDDFDDNASDLSQTPPKFVPEPPPALSMSLTRQKSEEKLDFAPRNLNDSPWTMRPKPANIPTIPSTTHPINDRVADMPWKKAERNSRSSEDLIEAVNREIHPKVSRARPAASTLPLNTRNPVTAVSDGRSSFRPFRNIFNRLRKTKSRRSTMNVSDDKSSTLASNSHMSGSLISNINEDELLDEVTTTSAIDINEKPIRSGSTRRSKSVTDAKKQSIFARLFSRKAK